MSATWTIITPKTNWNLDDYFDADDFNRIIKNIVELVQESEELFGEMNVPIRTLDLRSYNGYIYAEDFNDIAKTVSTINQKTYKLPNMSENYGQSYYGNGYAPSAGYFNTIESMISKLHERLKIQKENIPRLAILLGDSERIG